jgi:O-succinylbenzoate synthase
VNQVIGSFSIALQPYRRSFKKPLQTAHGWWTVREGFVLCLQDAEGRVGRGEMAPIPWFGTETLDQVLSFCQNLGGKISVAQIQQIPDRLPVCQFGFESAWEMLTQSSPKQNQVLQSSYLLPTGISALNAWQSAWTAGNRTFKWKIGVEPIAQEMKYLDLLLGDLPVAANLRLDANGGLTWETANQWMQYCDRMNQSGSAQIEFVEQPLLPSEFDCLLALSQSYKTPIALDESVATIAHLEACYQKGWRSIFVIKPAIAGSPARLRKFCWQHQPDVVWSSALETAIGRNYIEQSFIPSSPPASRAIGFGVGDWLRDEE